MNYFEKLELINIDLDRMFPAGNNPFQIMTRLLEEAGELAEQVHIFEKSGVKAAKHGEPDPHKMAKEIQDVIGCALQVKQGIEMRFEKRLESDRFTAEELESLS
ncbi:MAG: NTP pyrophosphatase (non-canonical NTP hydrolase) [Cellvibrionaceae bacterium]|jgi:NTP pyrophosphatase (non-canonical NTP hydrolase)